MDISEIDKNFKKSGFLQFDEIEWYDIHTSPIEIYGAFDKEKFTRLPENVAKATNSGVAELYKHTAGIRARFATNSPYVTLCAELDGLTTFEHMTLIGSSGFDIYNSNTNAYLGVFRPEYSSNIVRDTVYLNGENHWYSQTALLNDDSVFCPLTLNFPLYNSVKSVHVGIKKGCALHKGANYENKKIIYYGSSITQGGCASRPGMCYQNIIERRNNCDYINLGFSGNAMGEETIAEYISSLETDLLVLDYDHNARTTEELEATHKRFYNIFRKKQPLTPIIIVTAPTVIENNTFAQREKIIRKTYDDAIASGDKNIYFINGLEFFYNKVGYEYTVDKCHPTDLGFMSMANVIAPLIDKIL